MVRFAGILAPALLVLHLSAHADEPSRVAFEIHEDYLDFRFGPDLVSRYHIDKSVAKPYFWPVYGSGQIPMTRSWPMGKATAGGSTDHIHQKSAWFCHGDVIPEGIPIESKIRGIEGIDFWSEGPGHGRIVCTKVGEVKKDDKNVWPQTQNQWQTAEGVPVFGRVANASFV
jgi:hypothetical protein